MQSSQTSRHFLPLGSRQSLLNCNLNEIACGWIPQHLSGYGPELWSLAGNVKASA